MDNLLQTLRFLEKYHLEVVRESQLILVCQDSCPEIPTKFKSYKHINLSIKGMHLPYVTNVGVENAESEKLIILESDRVLPKGYFSTIIDRMSPGALYSPRQMVKLKRYVDDETIDAIQLSIDPRLAKYEDRSTESEPGRRNAWSGNTAIMKSDYILAGKMDEAYKGEILANICR